MSIVGQPQEINTVKSSWEVLDSPVPLGPDTSHHSVNQKSTILSPDLNETDIHHSLMHGSSGYLTEHNIEISVQECIPKYKSSPIETAEQITEPSNNFALLIPDISISTENNKNKLDESPTAPNSSGTAIFVSSQRRPTVDIAETIVTEFENRARKTRSAKNESKTEEAFDFENFTNTPVKKDIGNTDFRYSTEETNMSDTTAATDPNTERTNRDNLSVEVPKSAVTESRSTNSREYVRLPKIPNFPMNQTPHNYASVSQSNGQSNSLDNSHTFPDNRNITERDRFHERNRNPPAEFPVSVSQCSREHPRQQEHESRDTHRRTQHRHHTSARQNDNTRSRTANEHQRDTHTRGTNVTNGDSLASEEMDNPHTEADESFPRQALPLSYVQIPSFHPPPTIIQNGISQNDLLELMSKGLGQFTTEMAGMVIEKLKPEHEALAKQVGIEVKESTVTELHELREKLKVTEAALEVLKVERDNLKVENNKEREQMKKDFEKERLKRVKEFEEKKELIETLQKENNQLKTSVGEKDKSLKKAWGKAKSEEQKRIKLGEESEQKRKELQKELDKVKGELLVQKSKKRLQVSSAQSKKECLGKLNSKHGTYIASKHFNGHVPIPYDEGDD